MLLGVTAAANTIVTLTDAILKCPGLNVRMSWASVLKIRV